MTVASGTLDGPGGLPEDGIWVNSVFAALQGTVLPAVLRLFHVTLLLALCLAFGFRRGLLLAGARSHLLTSMACHSVVLSAAQAAASQCQLAILVPLASLFTQAFLVLSVSVMFTQIAAAAKGQTLARSHSSDLFLRWNDDGGTSSDAGAETDTVGLLTSGERTGSDSDASGHARVRAGPTYATRQQLAYASSVAAAVAGGTRSRGSSMLSQPAAARVAAARVAALRSTTVAISGMAAPPPASSGAVGSAVGAAAAAAAASLQHHRSFTRSVSGASLSSLASGMPSGRGAGGGSFQPLRPSPLLAGLPGPPAASTSSSVSARLDQADEPLSPLGGAPSYPPVMTLLSLGKRGGSSGGLDAAPSWPPSSSPVSDRRGPSPDSFPGNRQGRSASNATRGSARSAVPSLPLGAMPAPPSPGRGYVVALTPARQPRQQQGGAAGVRRLGDAPPSLGAYPLALPRLLLFRALQIASALHICLFPLATLSEQQRAQAVASAALAALAPLTSGGPHTGVGADLPPPAL